MVDRVALTWKRKHDVNAYWEQNRSRQDARSKN